MTCIPCRPSPHVNISVSPTPEQFDVIKGKEFAVNFYIGRSKKLRSGTFVVPEFGLSESGQREGWIWFDNYDGCSKGVTINLTIVRRLPSIKVKKRTKSAAGIQFTGKVIYASPPPTAAPAFKTAQGEMADWPFPMIKSSQEGFSDKSRAKPTAKKIATKPIVKKAPSRKAGKNGAAMAKVAKPIERKSVTAKKVVKKITAKNK